MIVIYVFPGNSCIDKGAGIVEAIGVGREATKFHSSMLAVKYFSSLSMEICILKPTVMEKIFFALRTAFQAHSTGFTRLDCQKHRYPHQDSSRSFPRAFWSSSPFLEGLIVIFWRNKSVFRNMHCCSKLGQKILDFSGYLAKNHEVVRNGKFHEQTNYESGETEKCVRKLSENYGEHSEESIGVFGRPAE